MTEALAAVGAFVALVGGVAAYVWRKAQARHRAASDAAYRGTRERIDNADTGIGASDRERIDRLRAFGERNGPR